MGDQLLVVLMIWCSRLSVDEWLVTLQYPTSYLGLNERSSLNLTFTGICWLTLEFEGQGSKDIISGEVSLDSSSLACMPDLSAVLWVMPVLRSVSWVFGWNFTSAYIVEDIMRLKSLQWDLVVHILLTVTGSPLTTMLRLRLNLMFDFSWVFLWHSKSSVYTYAQGSIKWSLRLTVSWNSIFGYP